MPHLSKKQLAQKMVDDMDRLIISLIKDSPAGIRLEIFRELLTKTETAMLAKRLTILLLLEKGMSLYKISNVLGVSPSTASRFALKAEQRRYPYATRWIRKKIGVIKVEEIIDKLVRLAFTGRTKSFVQSVREM